MNNKLMVVDKEQTVCDLLKYNLHNEGYEVTCVNSAEDALNKINTPYSLILLDVVQRGMSGYEMVEVLHNKGYQIPIVFLSTRNKEKDILTGFSVGADDYIIKPFSVTQVIARIKAILKRSEILHYIPRQDKSLISFRDMSINLETKEVFIQNEQIPLTKNEFEILALLAQNTEKLFSRKDIITKIWSETTSIKESAVDVHISRLRKKLGNQASVICNRRNYGFRFNSNQI